MRDCSAQFELFIELLHKLQNRVGVRAQKRGEGKKGRGSSKSRRKEARKTRNEESGRASNEWRDKKSSSSKISNLAPRNLSPT